MVNKVFLIGHLGKDPEVRSTASGTPVANFTMATNRRWTDRDGNRQEETEWHRIVVWARQAEIAGQYLRRGRQVFVEGRLQTRSWEDRQTGETKYTTEVVCENFKMLGSRGDSGGPPGDYAPPGGGYGGGGGDHGGGYGGGAPEPSGAGYGGAGGGTPEPGSGAQGGAPVPGGSAPEEDDDIPF